MLMMSEQDVIYALFESLRAICVHPVLVAFQCNCWRYLSEVDGWISERVSETEDGGHLCKSRKSPLLSTFSVWGQFWYCNQSKVWCVLFVCFVVFLNGGIVDGRVRVRNMSEERLYFERILKETSGRMRGSKWPINAWNAGEKKVVVRNEWNWSERHKMTLFESEWGGRKLPFLSIFGTFRGMSAFVSWWRDNQSKVCRVFQSVLLSFRTASFVGECARRVQKERIWAYFEWSASWWMQRIEWSINEGCRAGEGMI
jgi:hypothetical protein